VALRPIRKRRGLQERIELRNETAEPLRVDLRLEVASDFADIISVKLHDFSLGDPELAQELPPPAPARYDADEHVLKIEDPRGDIATLLALSQPARAEDGALSFDVALGAHEAWHVSVDVVPSFDGRGEDEIGSLDVEREAGGEAVVAWTLRVPRVRGGWEAIRRAFDRSIDDLAALRMRSGQYRRPIFAAGMPWFMTVFGRC
jgi:glycogen debranching enzyme